MIALKNGFSGERSLVIPSLIIKLMEEDPLLSILHITDIGYYPKANHHYRNRQTAINQFVMIYCVDGRGRFSIYGKDYPVTAHQYFILPAGVPHSYASNDADPWTIYWIHFKGSAASLYAKDACCPIDIRPSVDSRINNRITLFEDIFNTLKLGYSKDNLQYVSSLFHYFLGSLRYVQPYRKSYNESIDDESVVGSAIHFMKENMERHLSLQSILDYVGYSSSHFSMLFKQKTGYSPLSYFNILKIQYACGLLDTSDMKIVQICHKVGIEDPYYFSRLFKKISGVSPEKYRLTKKG